MPNQLAGVQPSVLRWARESQGLSVEDVALHLSRSPEEVLAWEGGDAAPTYAQLENLAYKLYKRPLAVFFLPKPPVEPILRKEFRTLPDFELDVLAADTRYQIRLAHAFQLSLRELNDGVNPAARKVFEDIQLSPNSDVKKAAQALRHYLDVSLTAQFSWTSVEAALKSWRSAVEEVGVFVFKHSFKQKSISGFCLVDDEFPVIYLNNGTTKTRQIFSLFHELAHLLLHMNAIGKVDQSYIEYLPQKEQRIERFCNALAAEFLMPSDDFLNRIQSQFQITEDSLSRLAKRYRVSREVVLRRLLDLGMVEQAHYESMAQTWSEEAGQSGGEGGDYYATQAAYLGEPYLRMVFGRHYQGKLSLEQVADYLGVRTKSVAGLEALMLQRAGA